MPNPQLNRHLIVLIWRACMENCYEIISLPSFRITASLPHTEIKVCEYDIYFVYSGCKVSRDFLKSFSWPSWKSYDKYLICINAYSKRTLYHLKWHWWWCYERESAPKFPGKTLSAKVFYSALAFHAGINNSLQKTEMWIQTSKYQSFLNKVR